MTGYNPLSWPEGWSRSTKPEDPGARFGYGLTIHKATQSLYREFALMGVGEVQLTSNLALRLDGQPRGNQAQPADPGVAVYFTSGDRRLVLACDRYTKVEANIRALALIIESMRRIERYGGNRMMERAFTGFTSITYRKPGWREVLGVVDDCNDLATCEKAYRRLAKLRHPDNGGSVEMMAELNLAIKKAREELS